MIQSMSYIDYGEMLKLLRLPTLSYRREMIGVWTNYHVYDNKSIEQPSSKQGLGEKKLKSSASPPPPQSCSFYYMAPVS